MMPAAKQTTECDPRTTVRGDRVKRQVSSIQRSWAFRKKLRLMSAQCTSKSSRLYLLYFLNCRQKQAGTSQCSTSIGRKTSKTVMADARPMVTLIFLRILLLMRMTSAKILRDLTVRMISKYFMMVTQVQLSALPKKKLHSNQKISNFLACHPNSTIRKQGSICDQRFRFTNTVSSRIFMPARQMLSKISRIQAAPSICTSTSHPLRLSVILLSEQLRQRIPHHFLPPVDIETLNLPSTLPKC